jgi:CRP/FNR family transcriptional regulator, nitrogen oxide reductase regulator
MRQVSQMSLSARGQQLSEPLMGKVSERHRAAILASSLGATPLSGKITYIQQASLFNDLSDAECTEIARMAGARRFLSAQVLFRAGDPASCVVFLASGRVKVSQVSRSGSHVLLAIVGGCNVVGGLGLEPGTTYSVTAQSVEACRVLTWNVRVFDDLCMRFPALARNSLRILAEQQRTLEERVLELGTEQAAPRLAGMLIRLLEQSGCSIHKPARIVLLRAELAEMIGATIFTVSRLLCDWENLGILEPQRKAVVVRDPIRLIEFADAIRRVP